MLKERQMCPLEDDGDVGGDGVEGRNKYDFGKMPNLGYNLEL